MCHNAMPTGFRIYTQHLQHEVCKLLCAQVLVLWSCLCPMDYRHSATMQQMSPGGWEGDLQGWIARAALYRSHINTTHTMDMRKQIAKSQCLLDERYRIKLGDSKSHSCGTQVMSG